jgi:hypothetical protein
LSSNLTDKIKLFLEKIPEFTKHASQLTEDENFKKIINASGSIGGLMKLSLFVIEKVYQHFQGEEKIAFSQLLIIMVNSSNESLKSIKNPEELKIKDVERNADFINDLLSIFISTRWNRHLFNSDNPVIKKYQNEIIRIMKENEVDQRSITKLSIIFEDRFTNNLKKDRIKYNQLNSYLKKIESQNHVDELIEYLERTYNSQFFYENKIDGRFLHQYYIVNDTFEVSTKYWRKDSQEINEKVEWNYKKFLKSTDPNDDYAVISASFGIGKSSYSRYLTLTLADEFLKNPSNADNYIPILIPLKDNFNNVYGKRNFEAVLNLVSNEVDKGGKKRKYYVYWMA